jgi:quercetin dioxygenase-like cupin family protein
MPNRIALTFLILACLGLPARAGEPVVVTRLLSATETAAGQPIMPPAGPVEVTVSTYDIAPGARLPVHRHPWPRYAYVLSGTLTVTNADTGAETAYGPGAVVLEMVGLWHYGENRGSEPVRLVVFDQTPPGEAATVLRQEGE